MGVEQFDQLGKIRQGPRQAIDLVDDDDVDPTRPNIVEQSLKGWPISGPA